MDLAMKYICPDNNKDFCSKDIFSIEFTGPNKPHLTVVDLPGLIQAANKHQSQADVDAIRDLAYSYMRNQRTIILAIVSAASDLELQPVLAQQARQFDPNGARTLGIITKPDKTETPEREAQFLELARNENIKFKLGWHVLRNRAPNEMNSTTEDRKRTEKQFFAPPSNWSQLGPDHLGIETLRLKLSKELVKHVMHEMPMVQQEIRSKLDETRRALEKLGDRKDTPEEMRDELRELCEKSQALTRTAMEGQYADLYGPPFFHPSPPSPTEAIRKLRARIVLQNERFAEEMTTIGHLVEILDGPPGSPGAPPPDVQNTHHPMRLSRADFIRHHVEPLLNASPGLELRMDKNPLLVYTLFRNYSQNWPEIATRHIEEIQAICNDFLQEVVDFIWPEDMRPRAWVAFVEERMETRLAEAYKEAGKLFKDRTRAAKPYDPEHTTKVLDWISRRNQVRQAANDSAASNGSTSALSGASAFLSEFAPDAFLQKMLVYYELTRKTFISNVIVQVVERHLVDELDRIFNVTRVVELDDAAVIEIASEDESLRNQRMELRNTRRILEAGERICRKYMARRDLKLDPEIRSAPNRLSDSSTTARAAVGRTAKQANRREINQSQSYQIPPPPPIQTYEPPEQTYQEPPTPTYVNPISPNRASSRATQDTQRPSTSSTINNPTVDDPYAPSAYNRHRQDPASGYGDYESNNGYTPSAPAVPPRPANQPPLPPKRVEDETEHGRRGGALRGVFGGRKQ
jgi:GTP-binding protein EngB required for normal cell division